MGKSSNLSDLQVSSTASGNNHSRAGCSTKQEASSMRDKGFLCTQHLCGQTVGDNDFYPRVPGKKKSKAARLQGYRSMLYFEDLNQ